MITKTQLNKLGNFLLKQKRALTFTTCVVLMLKLVLILNNSLSLVDHIF